MRVRKLLVAVLAVGIPACGGGGGPEPEPAPDAGPEDVGSADVPEIDLQCDGKPLLTPCDDGDPCTVEDRCDDERCVGIPKGCGDGDACTIDLCDPIKGCFYKAAEDGLACVDGRPCRAAGVCKGGACEGTKLESIACDDGDPCSLEDHCVAGVCAGKANTCNDLEPCTEDFCDPTHAHAEAGTGCVHDPFDGICDDVNPCTKGDVCKAGKCAGTPQVGKTCSDNDFCTSNETCQEDGTCQGVLAFTCEDDNPCTIDTCLAGGGCTFLPDVGAPCTDHLECTVEDACDPSGACAGKPKCATSELCAEVSCVEATGECKSEALDCDDGNACTDDSCDPEAGCVLEDNEDLCDDGDLCTFGDQCAAGACLGTAVACDPSNDTACRANLCQPKTGSCALQDTNGAPCDDGDPCTADACSLGSCASLPVLCDDVDPCTYDACDGETGGCDHDALESCGDAAVDRANRYRTWMGLPLLAHDEAIAAAALAHATYYVKNFDEVFAEGLSPHLELPGYEGFTGATFGERLAAAGYAGNPLQEVMAFTNDPVAAVDGWMTTLYHRLPFLLAAATDVGYGGAQKGFVACDTADFGSSAAPPAAFEDAILPFPPDGATGVPLSWDGLESPQPPLPKDYPSGPILTITFGDGAGAESVAIEDSAILGPDGPLLHVASSPLSDPALCCGTIALYAFDPLAPLTTYTVVVDYEWNGKAGTTAFSFTTGEETGKQAFVLP